MNYTDLVQQLYIAYYGRPADPTGLAAWVEALTKVNGDTSKIIASFADSAESKALYNGTSTVSFVNQIYNNVLGRDADITGLTGYAKLIDTGALTRSELALVILKNVSGTDVALAANKLAAAKAFTAAIDTAAEVLKYTGDTAAQQARDFLKAVTGDAATVPDAAKAQTAVDGLTGATNPGQTFTLTAGADTVTGTAGNDTINALTIKADGTSANTFTAFDVIDGGAGTDTLNLYSDNTANFNDTFPATTTVKNVENVNIFNSNAAAGVFGDASKYEGVTTLTQIGFADSVTKLAATTTAAFKTVDANVSVAPTDAAASVKIALDNYGEGRTITVDGSAAAATLNAVTVSGTVKDTDSNGTVNATTVAVSTGKDVESVTVTTAVKTTLTVTENAASGATKDVRTVDVSASTGAVTFAGSVTSGTAGSVATIKGGSGDDTLTIVTATLKDDAATTADETVSALVEGGAGKDNITINTTGTGTTTVNGGDGNDTVTLTADGSGKLTVNLGAGDDTFKGAGSVVGTDSIDGGAGTDTLLLNMVGVANIGAFANFETFDTAGLAKTLDVDILATKNTVTEFVASADVGAAAVLTNVGAGVGYRVTGDTTVANTMTLTQKTAGALTITLDIDEASTTAANFDSGAKTNVDAGVVASNATSIKAVFDSSFKDEKVDSSDNLTNLTITGTKATSLEVVSGGAFAINDLVYTSGDDSTAGKGDLLTSVTISGDRAITVAITEADASEVTAINASSLTGALTISTAELKAESAANKFDGGVLTLGSGADVITIVQGAAISGLAKGSVKDATAQGAFDVLSTGAAVAQAADVASTGSLKIKDGLFTFEGTGPATLAAAISAVDTQLTTDGDAVVFEYIGNSYVFVNNDTTNDIVVKLTGVTGLTGLDEVGTSNNLYVF